MRKTIVYTILGAVTAVTACTDLVVDEEDSLVIASEGQFSGVEVDGALTTAYNNLNWQNTQEGVYALSVATTDEQFIPTRGTDWGDNGVWRDLARHAWTSSHLFNNNAWNYLNGNVFSVNQILHEATTKTDLQEAEARFIRAYNMYWILDLWRQVPFREADEGPDVAPRVMNAQEAFDFIVADLEAALPVLPATPANDINAQSRASKAAANFMLAKLFLNKHIFLGTGQAADADMDRVIQAVEAIEADGYTVHDGFFEIFGPSADSETIFWSNGQYASRIWGALHYSQGKETDHKDGGWNGFATTAEFYSKFEGPADSNPEGGPQEERRGYVPEDRLGIGFLIGPQYGPDGVLLARSGQPLVFTKEVPSLTGNPDYTGIRLLKWHPTINMPGTWSNHLVLMRYADALLMKAEAIFRKGDAATALDFVNELRTIRDATPLGTLTEQDILDERGRELYMEAWRRNDLVRFEQFNRQFGFVDIIDDSRNIYPIPDNALGSNPNLIQNPGY